MQKKEIMSENVKQNEIDLIVLFFKIYRLFKRYFLLLIIATLLGAGYSVYTKIRNNKIAESEYIIDINTGQLVVVSEIFNNLIDLLKTDKEGFAKKFETDIIDIDKIKEFEFVFERPDQEVVGTISVNLTIKHMNYNKVDDLAENMINYINNIPYFAKKKERRIEHINEKIDEINLKIKETDSLQKIFIESYLMNNKLIYFNQDNSQTALQRQKLKLIEDRQGLENNLENVEIMYVVDSITRQYKQPLLSLAIFPVITFLLGFIVMVFKEINKLEKRNRK